MNQTVKRLWIEALTGKRYKKTVNWLRVDNVGYCCLGVLCDLHRLQTEEGHWNTPQRFNGATFYTTGEMSESVTLSVAVMDWSGIDIEYVAKLSNMNDSGHSFRDIAEQLEEDFPDEAEIEVPTREMVTV